MDASEARSGPLSAELVGSRYRLLRPLGDGADGRFLALDGEGEQVILELVDAGDDASSLVGQLEAARRLAPVDHPHVLPVQAVGIDEASGRVFLAFAPFEGTDVRRLVVERGPIDPTSAVRVIMQACRGVAAVRALGGTPRALKPSDLVLVGGSEGEATVRIAALDNGRTRLEVRESSGTGVGPLDRFTPPERRGTSAGADESSDVWRLGACLYWLLSGSPPAADDSHPGSMASIQELAPWVEPGLTIALHLALHRDADLRWPTARAFANALEPFSNGEDRLHAGSLVGVDEALRRHVSERADPKALRRPAADPNEAETKTPSSTGLFGRLQQEPAGLDALIGQKLAGRWEILRVIGRGGMGAVFEVALADGTRAAAKLIDRQHIGADEETYKRFLREAKAAGAIDSPHVVKTIEAGLDGELKAPFIIMELLDGVDLKSVLRRHGPLCAQPVVRLFLQAARGIADAHAQSIVHRDIKPANLFLHQGPDGQLVVKVCDFGIAKRTAEVDGDQTGSHDLTRTGGMLGSPAYMSPEQATNARNVDHRTDIWSLCISLYEALSGRKPWAGRSALGEIIVAICTQQVPPLHRVAPWVDRGLAEVVHRGLKPEIGDRYASVHELISALEPYAGGGEELVLHDLLPVSESERALQPLSLPPPPPDRAAATLMGGVLDQKIVAPVATVQAPAKRRPTRLLALGIGVVLVIAAVMMVRARLSPSVAPAPDPRISTEPTTTGSVAAPTTRARVKIEPANARVTVDGKSVTVSDGYVDLDGPPGTEFAVAVTGPDGATKSVSVVLARGGAVPASVTLDQEPAKGTTKRPLTRTGPSAAPAPSSSPATPPTGKPTGEPAHPPEFKNEWK